MPPYHVKTMQVVPAMYAGMPVALGKMKAHFAKEGGKIAFNTKARQLIMSSSGKVVGVRTMSRRGSVLI